VVMRWVNRSRHPNRSWFDGRAVAESIKTNSWRYMMCTDPFAGSDADADARFIGDLREILYARRELPTLGVPSGAGQITSSMRKLRAEPFDVRRSTYIQRRLKDQIAWYSDRAAHHQSRASLYFVVGLLAELMALAWAILRIAVSTNLNLIGVFTSLAVAATALSQLHSHDELGGSYGLAAQELSAILTLAESTNEDKFSDVVKDAEGAISREHTMWIAKRG
jgi:SMODS and SLOG-associating 2TM effector domain 1/SMODS and SLOG-associating 2TM effector domain 3